MKTDRRVLWARIFLTLCLAEVAINFVIWVFTQSGASTLGYSVVAPPVLAVLAFVIIARQPGNAVGWLLLISAVTWANPIEPLLQVELGPPAHLTPVIWLLLWVNMWSWIPAIFPYFLIPLYFPTGRPPTPRWRWVSRLAVALWVVFMILAASSGEIGPLNADWLIPNPIGWLPAGGPGASFWLFWGVALLSLPLGSIASLFVRYRQAPAGERQQIKALLYAGAIFAVVYGVNYFLNDLDVPPFALALSDFAFGLSILSFPVTIAIAILRHRLYDIDLIIRKTLVYTVLTGLLGLVYSGLIIILRGVFDIFSGQQSQGAIVLSTLAIAALFAPLRRRVQTIIDRRFYRRKFDAQQVLARFGQAARDEISADALAAELTRVVEEVLQPAQVTLWMERSERVRTAE